MKVAFLLKRGVIAVGIPSAIALNFAVLWLRGDFDLVLSLQNAIELTFMLLLVAPLVGALAGHALWVRAQQRAGYPESLVVVETDDTPLPEIAEIAVDEQQRKLSALQARLDALARTDPKRLTWEIAGMTALGYGYVLMVVAILVIAVVLLAHVQGDMRGIANIAARVLGWFAFFVLTALYVRVLEPTGRRLTQGGTSTLFATLESIQRRLNAPAPDVVIILGEFNASVTETPRLGIIGLPKRYLTVGLPLLEALPTDECTAILAHEMAHLSRRHGRRTLWVGRLNVTWRTLATTLAVGRHWARPLFLPFFRWYAPRFECYAHAVSRRDEHESDALAAECVGAPVAARALLRLHLYQQFVAERVLPNVFRLSAERPDPPGGVFEQIAAAVRAGPSRDDLRKWSDALLAERTLDAHTHPSLADRIARLGVSVDSVVDDMIATTGQFGADDLLGARRLPKLRSQVEHDWQVEMLPAWRRLHAEALVWRSAERRDGFEVELEPLWAHARWAADCEPGDVAHPLVREVLRRSPRHAEAQVTLGRLLTQSHDDSDRTEGVALLEEALKRDTGLALVACSALEAHYQRLGWRSEVDRMQTRERQVKSAMLEGLRERRELRSGDRLTAYALPASTLATLQKACALQKQVVRAYLVRKQTRLLREQPCVMLVVEPGVPWYKADDGAALEACHALLERITLPEVADLFVLPVRRRSALLRRLRAVPGATIYQRAER